MLWTSSPSNQHFRWQWIASDREYDMYKYYNSNLAKILNMPLQFQMFIELIVKNIFRFKVRVVYVFMHACMCVYVCCREITDLALESELSEYIKAFSRGKTQTSKMKKSVTSKVQRSNQPVTTLTNRQLELLRNTIHPVDHIRSQWMHECLIIIASTTSMDVCYTRTNSIVILTYQARYLCGKELGTVEHILLTLFLIMAALRLYMSILH